MFWNRLQGIQSLVVSFQDGRSATSGGMGGEGIHTLWSCRRLSAEGTVLTPVPHAQRGEQRSSVAWRTARL